MCARHHELYRSVVEFSDLLDHFDFVAGVQKKFNN